MYEPQLYRGKTEAEIRTAVMKLGFDPIKINNQPGYVYAPHSHKETKLLAFLSGSMTLQVAEKTYDCRSGDQVIIPGNIIHSATVGPEGCTFFWSEKIV